MAAALDKLKAFAEFASREISNHRETGPPHLPNITQRTDAMDVDDQESARDESFRLIVEEASKIAQQKEEAMLDTPTIEFTGEESNPHIPVSDYRLTEEDVVADGDVWSIAAYLGDDWEKRIVSTPFSTVRFRL